MSAEAGVRARAHPNTIPRQPSPTPAAEPDEHQDAVSWDNDVTRPGDPSDLAALASRTIGSAITALPEQPMAAPEVTGPAPERPGLATPALARVETDGTVMGRARPRDRRWVVVAVAAASALGGLVAGYLLRGGDVQVASSVAPTPDDAVRSLASRQPTAARLVPAAAPPASMRCRATIDDVPDGVAVQWGDVSLGLTPLADIEVPCGAATVVMTHPRYERLERAVTTSPAAIVVVDGAMKRPLGTLDLRSVPPGATFTIDGAAVEPGAGEVKVRMFTQISIVAQLPGYATATRRMYVGRPHDAVVVQLATSGHHR